MCHIHLLWHSRTEYRIESCGSVGKYKMAKLQTLQNKLLKLLTKTDRRYCKNKPVLIFVPMGIRCTPNNLTALYFLVSLTTFQRLWSHFHLDNSIGTLWPYDIKKTFLQYHNNMSLCHNLWFGFDAYHHVIICTHTCVLHFVFRQTVWEAIFSTSFPCKAN